MYSLLRDKFVEVIQAAGPLVGVVAVLLVLLLDEPGVTVLQFLAGSALVIAGMVLLFAGLDIGILPMTVS